MPGDFQVFDASRTPWMSGVNLVEASAGTGKTYAIGMLVLRALIELNIPIEKILIVTFTKAATEELKSRIRKRLVDARDILAGKVEENCEKTDTTLLDWIATIKDQSAAFNTVQLALYDIDRAGIFTIHGFCQRMLVEQALESGQFFDVELLADINQVKNEVAEDFWRTTIYSLAPMPCALLTSNFCSPEKLLASVASVIGGTGAIEPDACQLEVVLTKLESVVADLAVWWLENSAEFHRLAHLGLDLGYFKKQFALDFENWFQSLSRFFTGKEYLIPPNINLLHRDYLIDELNGNTLRGDRKKQEFLSGFQLPGTEIETLLDAIKTLLLSFRVKLASKLRSEMRRRLELRGSMSFDDLIFRLSEALQDKREDSLRKLLSDRYKVALIDEFQDTDSNQWFIFSTLFGDSQHYLYLIGDPKQAIYKFRDADIHSYFQARKTAQRLLTLEWNYRSHPFLIEEINRLFGSRRSPFYYEESVLDYRQVHAAKRESDAEIFQNGNSLAGMAYWLLGPNPEDRAGRWTSGKAAKKICSFTVAEITKLLDPSQPAILKTAEERPLAPYDIAILVRSNRQAEEYREALTEASIPAAIGSRQSVLLTKECRDLLIVLQAVATPGDTGSLKSAMSLSWFGLTGNRLDKLWQDEKRLSELHGRFQLYNQLWSEQGLLVMMNRLLVDEEVLPHLARGSLAERAIANIYHLLELVQEVENNEHLGISQLLQWLKKMVKQQQGMDNAELLLESDEDAVRIVTMHSAKGMEYPVVFCPYLWYGSNRIKSERHQIRCYDEEDQQLIDLGSDSFEIRKEQAIHEEMAEDLRLLYVALTRAKIRCYTSWADVKAFGVVSDSFQSSLGYLLFEDGNVDYREQQLRLLKLAEQKSVEVLVLPDEEQLVHHVRAVQQQELRPAIGTTRSLQTDWQVTSFSALASMSEYDLEIEPEINGAENFDQHPLIAIPGLPAGANFGNVIHDLLESCSFKSIASQKEQETLVSLVRQKCTRFGVETDISAVVRLLELIVATPLSSSPGTGNYSLSMLTDDKCLKETGFYFSLTTLVTDQINEILADEPTVAPISHKVMRGYLTGFIDLICEYEGKFYLFDYKTNYLGDLLSDYRADKLVPAMQAHNYGLQYWIYTLVLHRYLQHVLPEYDYLEHFGGVRYLFVRGMIPSLPGNGVYEALPDFNILQQLDLAIGGREHG